MDEQIIDKLRHAITVLDKKYKFDISELSDIDEIINDIPILKNYELIQKLLENIGCDNCDQNTPDIILLDIIKEIRKKQNNI